MCQMNYGSAISPDDIDERDRRWYPILVEDVPGFRAASTFYTTNGLIQSLDQAVNF